ncbi:MAG: ATPase domain-containing protein, partial [Nanoarchaeota archaeon]
PATILAYRADLYQLIMFLSEKKKATPEQVKKVLVEGGGIIDSIIDKIKVKRIVIDSITSFSLLYSDELTKKEAALALFDLINKWNCTAVLTSQAKATDHQIYMDAALDFEVDSILILYHTKKEGERIRAFEILKMRGTNIPTKTYGVNIAKNGLKIENKIIKL